MLGPTESVVALSRSDRHLLEVLPTERRGAHLAVAAGLEAPAQLAKLVAARLSTVVM